MISNIRIISFELFNLAERETFTNKKHQHRALHVHVHGGAKEKAAYHRGTPMGMSDGMSVSDIKHAHGHVMFALAYRKR